MAHDCRAKRETEHGCGNQECDHAEADPKMPAKMTDAEFMNRFMTWVSESNPALRQIISDASIETLGHVVEGDFKHVVVRMKVSANGIDIDQLRAC